MQPATPGAAPTQAAAPGSARITPAGATPAVRFSVQPRIGGVATKAADAKALPKAVRPETPARSAAREEALAAQFGRGLAAALRQNGGTVTMRLQPEALGDLKIKMSLEPGKVEASFEVKTDQARDLLGKSMDSLRSALEAQGLEVSRLDVRVAEPTGAAQQDTGQQFGGADTHPNQGGGHGSENPRQGTEHAARTPRDEAEPVVLDQPGMGWEAGGALRVRLDALA